MQRLEKKLKNARDRYDSLKIMQLTNHGGSGNDTFNVPVYGVAAFIRGGDGDDVFETDREETAGMPMTASTNFYGEAGNDKITGLKFTPGMYGYGGTGDDKIIHYDNAFVRVAGNDGDDIIYGLEADEV